MREIKFRGRNIKGEWLYGDLINDNINNTPTAFIFPPDAPNSYDRYLVNPNTVGQFIGLYDINDKEIYFGDIVRNKYGDIGKIVWFHDCSIRVDCGGDDIHFMDPDLGLEVIGNIFDNPELIKSL
ncbi:MAG: hypothetical protein J6B41_07090 [Alistipes sp.]|nr:hypothetical protein [Alistipes sp.]